VTCDGQADACINVCISYDRCVIPESTSRARLWDVAATLENGSPLTRRLAGELFEGIVTGAHPAGSLLTAVEVAQAANVSRTPAHEALLALERVGLVRLLPKKGAVVTPLTIDQEHDLLSVRAMFECAAIDTLAADDDVSGRASALDLDLQEMLAEQRAAVAAADLLAFATADFAFHARIVSEARNSVVSETFAQLGPRLACLTYRAAARDSRLPERFYTDHQKLASLALRHDADQFRAVLTNHLDAGHPAH